MAGNIIPAIATTNAIVAGLIVTEALKILRGRIDLCRTVRFFLSLNFNIQFNTIICYLTYYNTYILYI